MTKRRQPRAGVRPKPILKKRPVLEGVLHPDQLHNPFGPKTHPTIQVKILSPQPGLQIYADNSVLLQASASNGVQDLSSEVHWHSSRGGFLGRGESIQATFSEGGQVLTALVVQLGNTAAKAKASTTTPPENELSVGIDAMAIDPTNYDGGGG